MTTGRRWRMEGLIASAGFASGDRVVIGHWDRSPVGPFTDLMWAEPDGTRRLLVPDDGTAAFVTAVYAFDAVDVVPLAATARLGARAGVRVVAGDRRVHVVGGWGIPFLVRRPPALTRRVEGPIARRLLAVETFGTSPTGVREWYQAARWRPVRAAGARRDGHDLGAFGDVWPPVGVGFSEPPRGPSLVEVRTVLHDPSGRLDALVTGIRR